MHKQIKNTYYMSAGFAVQHVLIVGFADSNFDMFAEFKFVFDYDSTPAPGAQKDNYRYTMGVGMRF